MEMTRIASPYPRAKETSANELNLVLRADSVRHSSLASISFVLGFACRRSKLTPTR